MSSPNNEEIWVQTYSTWDASHGRSLQPILPPPKPNNGDQQPPTSGRDAEQPVPLWPHIFCLRGGAGTPEPPNHISLTEEEPANAPADSHIHGQGNVPLTEEILNQFNIASRIDNRGEQIHEESGDNARTGFQLPDINDPTWIPVNDYGTIVYKPGPPRSHYSALSGDSSDLSDAASLHFHEQNAIAAEGEEEEEGGGGGGGGGGGRTAARLAEVTASIGQRRNNEGRIYTPGDGMDGGSDYSSTRSIRRRFLLENQPSSGSLNTSSILDGSIPAWMLQPPSPHNKHTDSDVDEAVDAMSEDGPLINPRPPLEPPTNNMPTRVPPLGYSYIQSATTHPTAPFAGVRRRDLLRHALRREQMAEHFLRTLRNMLVMGSEERKRLRRKE